MFVVIKKLCLLVSASLFILVGCESKEVVQEEPPVQNIEEPKEEIVEESETIGIPAPLTGVGYEEVKNDRPIAVIINNDIKARPQSGLHKADIVYEVLAEGDITRLIAIYQSEMPEVVGPVRSARDYFIDLANGYQTLFVFHGWSPAAKERIEAGAIDGINGLFYDGSLFKRASFRKAPHNSYITYENIKKGADQLHFDIEKEITPLSFTGTDSVTGEETAQVKIDYSSRQATHVEYIFNTEKQHYVRYSGGEKTTDLETLEDIVAHNIFIVEASHTVIDDKGRRDIDLSSGGKAILVQAGVRNEVEWRTIEGRIIPFTNDQPISFVPGKTWINIVPSLGAVHFE